MEEINKHVQVKVNHIDSEDQEETMDQVFNIILSENKNE